MIRISTKGRYALRAMVDLANHKAEEPVARSDIAHRQDISADYVAQLFRSLQDVGLVEGVKGPGGGYRLGRSADRIRARDVIEAVEGPVVMAPCIGDCEESACPHTEHCPTRHLWEQLSNKIVEFLDSYTLADLGEVAYPTEPT